MKTFILRIGLYRGGLKSGSDTRKVAAATDREAEAYVKRDRAYGGAEVVIERTAESLT